ncbi:hypothetical protein M7M4_09770 [Corynebacterium pseudogenitalium]
MVIDMAMRAQWAENDSAMMRKIADTATQPYIDTINPRVGPGRRNRLARIVVETGASFAVMHPSVA